MEEKKNFKLSDVRFEIYRPLNHVRVVHEPTGIMAECGEHMRERVNRIEALKRLNKKIGKMQE